MSQEQQELWGLRRVLKFPQVTPPSSPEVHVTPPPSPAVSPRRSTRPSVVNPRYFGMGMDTMRPTRGRGRARVSGQRGRLVTRRTGFMDESSDEDQFHRF